MMPQTPFVPWSDRLGAGAGGSMISLARPALRQRLRSPGSSFLNWTLLKLLVLAHDLPLV